MIKLSPRYASIAYGIIQAALTTRIATAVATFQGSSFDPHSLRKG